MFPLYIISVQDFYTVLHHLSAMPLFPLTCEIFLKCIFYYIYVFISRSYQMAQRHWIPSKCIVKWICEWMNKLNFPIPLTFICQKIPWSLPPKNCYDSSTDLAAFNCILFNLSLFFFFLLWFFSPYNPNLPPLSLRCSLEIVTFWRSLGSRVLVFYIEPFP